MKQKTQREKAKEGLEIQAKKMISVSNANHPIAKEGTTVRIKIPEVDRSRTDPRSILAVVLERSDDGIYKLGTKKGNLKQLYARSQFCVCQEKLLAKDDVPDVKISLRQTATKQSISHGQGFRKCDCKSKCATNRCACLKNNFLCNSKCHQSLDCTNK